MYCKFCGNRITSSTKKCASCGADINVNDGGQTFFDDDELFVWQSSGSLDGPKTSMPKTQMGVDRKKENKQNTEKQSVLQSPSMQMRPHSSYGSKHSSKKPIFRLSKSNRTIIFCIASALVIVLLIVAIIAALSGGNDDTVTSTLEPQASVDAMASTVSEEKSVEAGSKPSVSPEADKEQDSVSVYFPNGSYDTVSTVVIRENGNDADYYGTQGIVLKKGNVVYLSADVILPHFGYSLDKDKSNNEKAIYNNDGETVILFKGTPNVYKGKTTADSNPNEKLQSNIYNDENNATYVPAEIFFEIMKCSKIMVAYSDGKIVVNYNR